MAARLTQCAESSFLKGDILCTFPGLFLGSTGICLHDLRFKNSLTKRLYSVQSDKEEVEVTLQEKRSEQAEAHMVTTSFDDLNPALCGGRPTLPLCCPFTCPRVSNFS